MSMTVPDTPIGGRRLPGIPDVNMGPHLTGDDFGAGRARDMEKLSRAIQYASDTFADKIAQASAHQQLANAKSDISRYFNQISSEYKGDDAKNIGKDLEEYTRGRMDEAKKKIGTNFRALKLFDENMLDYNAHNALTANDRMLAKAEAFRQDSLKAELEQNKIYAGNFAGDPSAVIHSIRESDRLVTELYRGASPERIGLEQHKAAMALVEETATALSEESGPKAAIDFLEAPPIRDHFTSAEFKRKFKALREKYGKAKTEADQKAVVDQATNRAIEIARAAAAAGESPDKAVQALYANLVREFGAETAQKAIAGYNVYDQLGDEARTEAEHAADRARQERERAGKAAEEAEAADAARLGRQLGDRRPLRPETSEVEARRIANEKFNEKAAKVMIEAFEAERKAIKADEATAKVERDKALDAELEEAGHDAARMKSWSSMTPDEKQSYLEQGRKIRSGLEPDKPKLNDGKYLEYLFDTSDDELLDIFADPERRKELTANLGGANTDAFNKVYARIKDKREGQAGGGKGGAVTTLDTDLNNVKRAAESAMSRAGLYAGKDNREAREEAVNSAVSYARKMYEDEMAARGVDDVKKLPVAVRNRIQAEAALVMVIKTPGRLYGYNEQPVTAAQAWEAGRDVSGAAVKPESLPPDLRRNYLGGSVRRDGDAFIATDVPSGALPENVRSVVHTTGGLVYRDLESGNWIVVGRNKNLLELGPNGEVGMEAVRKFALAVGQDVPSVIMAH